jgi:TorA-specific chaperone
MGEAMLLCEFLARVFAAPPDTTFVGSCRHGVGAALLAAFAKDDALGAAIQQMTGALEVSLPDEGVAEELEYVYTQLFSGVAGAETISLFASAHLEGRLFGGATGRMDAVLHELGLSVAADHHGPADHLAVQLAVLGERLGRDDTTVAQRFAEQHLRNWVPMFVPQCHARDPSGFYAGAATLVDRVTLAHASVSRAEAA